MIKKLVWIGILIGASTAFSPIGPPAGKSAQVLIKQNDSPLDEKPRPAGGAKTAAAPAPGNGPPPAPAPVPASVAESVHPMQAPVVTQAPPPPAIPVPPPVPAPRLTPLFLKMFQAAFKPTTAAPIAPMLPFLGRSQSVYGGRSPFAQMFQTAMPNYGYNYYPTTPSYYYNRRPRQKMCFGECKTEFCDFPEREVVAFCPGGGRKPKRCCTFF